MVDIEKLKREWQNKPFINSDYCTRFLNFDCYRPVGIGSKAKDNRGAGKYGVRGWGMCSHRGNPWALTVILEETDDYIIASCDAGCATILLKDSVKKKKPKKKKVEKVVNKDGEVVDKKKKTVEDNIFE